MRTFLNPWLWKMAWRDSRTHRSRLLLFVTSIVLGIAALVSIGSFGVTLDRAIDDQAKTLMGADLMFASLQPFSEKMAALIDSLGGEQSRVLVFGSMAYFPKTQNARLVQVRGVEGSYPFYGAIATDPPEAASTYLEGLHALVDDGLLRQFGIDIGDSVKIGNLIYDVAGRITKLPSNPPIASSFSPRVYLPAAHLDASLLRGRGSLVNHRIYFKFDNGRDVEKLVEQLKTDLNQNRIRVSTIKQRKEQVGEVLDNLYRFLNLIGFVALILGGIGVASAVHVYTKQKLDDVSILRCLGAESKQTFMIYLIQVGVMALLGSMVGAGLGIAVQTVLPKIFAEFLPVSIQYSVAWSAVARGMLVGLSLSILFALLPLLSVRNVSPLVALRSSIEGVPNRKDRARWFVALLILSVASGFALLQSPTWQIGAGFIVALLIAFGILALVAKLITLSFRKFFPTSWPYVWRQGLANLYRPNNQTLVLMTAIGLGTFLITTLYLSHDTLLNMVTYAGKAGRPDLVMFDIQPDQKERIAGLVKENGLPIVQEAPIVTMRLASINGESVGQILSDTTRGVSRGLLRWEFRTTYRDTLFASEKIVAGRWVGQVADEDSPIPISIEDGSAARMNLQLGDTLVWNVQGVPLTTTLASLRHVDWQRIQANFMVVFPEGALSYAPQVYILATKTNSTAKSASLQRQVVKAFPNVSMIDLALVLNTLDAFLGKVAFVIRFMAFFSILTGLIVLTAAVVTSRFQRVKESILLRTLGASRKQILRIMTIEYILLGSFATFTGLFLSYAGAWALSVFVFEATFFPTALPFIIVLMSVVCLTVAIGLANSRGILDKPPLEVLRLEA